MSKNRDGIRELTPESKASETLLSSPPPKLSLEDALATLAQHSVSLSAAVAGISGDREVFLRQLRDDDARYQVCKREAGKTAQARTQERADKRYPARPDDKRYKVALMSWKTVFDRTTGKNQRQLYLDPAFVTCEINAASESEAKARYEEHCGIISVDHEKSSIKVFAADEQIAGEQLKADDEESREMARLQQMGLVEVT